MRTSQLKDGSLQVYLRISQSTWESLVRVSMEQHVTPEQLLKKAIEKVT